MTDTQPDPRDAEITILRGRVAELERALWQAKHDYGQTMQQNARHATTIAALQRTRTAEDERRDVLLKLDTLAAEKAAHGFTASGTVATARRDAAVSALRMAYEVIERGDHAASVHRPDANSTRTEGLDVSDQGPALVVRGVAEAIDIVRSWMGIINGIKAGKVYGTTPDGCIAEMSISQADLFSITAGMARTAEDERRDVLAFIKDEAGKFAAQAIADGWSERARDRLDGKASVLATILGYFERGDHVGAADR